jgi:hypothetical protein
MHPADVPGRYVVRVTERFRNFIATATLTTSPTCLSIDPPPSAGMPLALTPVNTNGDNNGHEGVTVGGCFWNQTGEFLAVYLYRNGANALVPLTTLPDGTQLSDQGVVGGIGYPVSQSGITAMYNDFNSLPTNGSVLVILMLPQDGGMVSWNLIGQPGTTSPPSLQSALAKIGAVLPPTYLLESGATDCWASSLLDCYGYVSYGSSAIWNSTAGFWNDQGFPSGSFSVIGVPGMSVGNAFYDSAVQRGTPQGTLIGYFTNDSEVGVANATAYTFVFAPYSATDAGQYAVVDSCAVTATSNCAIGVGEQLQFQQDSGGGLTEMPATWLHECDPQPGVNGLNLMVLDRVTLAPLQCTTVTSTMDLWNAIEFFISEPLSPTNGAHEQYQSPLFISDRVVVVIQSVGNLTPCVPTQPPTPPNPCPIPNPVSPTPISYANDPTLRLIDQLGGTPETFATTIGAPASGTTLPGAYPYALIGVAGNLPWHGKGTESSPLISAGQPCFISLGAPCVLNASVPGHVRVALSRDRMARYTPQAGDSTGVANFDLYPVIYQNPTPWPYSAADTTNGNASTVAAIGYIAGVLMLGPGYCDIRSAYVNSSTTTWSGLLSGNTTATTPPSSWPTSTVENACYQSSWATTPVPSNYANIVSQLDNEFVWVDEVNGFFTQMQDLFTPGNSNYVSTQAIATQIYNTVKPNPKAGVNYGWLNVVDGAMDILAVISGPLDPAFGLLAGIGDLSSALLANSSSSGASGGPGSQAYQIHVEATNLENQLADQSAQYYYALGNVSTILVEDAGKLQVVGSQLFGNTDWEWTKSKTGTANNYLSATATQSAYSALLPPSWLMWNLKPSFANSQNGTQTSSANQATWGCLFNSPPFANAVTYNSSTNPITFGNNFYSRFQMDTTGSAETSTTEAWSFAGYGTSSSAVGSLPTTSLTNDIFATITDSTNGVVQGAAYPPAWYRSTFNPPGVFTCTFDQSGNRWYLALPPYSSTPPIPATTIGPQQAIQTQD